jgi:hypothetical protein
LQVLDLQRGIVTSSVVFFTTKMPWALKCVI